jgi:hypothetical protein
VDKKDQPKPATAVENIKDELFSSVKSDEDLALVGGSWEGLTIEAKSQQIDAATDWSG